MRYIGDTHAKFGEYLHIAEEVPASIQVGDFGVGFRPVPDMPPGARFIRGNHDDPTACRAHPRWIADGTLEGDTFFLGGGFSVDREHRTEGLDWWADEELDMDGLYQAVDAYAVARPRIVVSHECPSDMAPVLFGAHYKTHFTSSRTSQALGSMLYLHRPEIFIFGHWHRNVDQTIDGTRFICLAELAYIDL